MSLLLSISTVVASYGSITFHGKRYLDFCRPGFSVTAFYADSTFMREVPMFQTKYLSIG